MKIFIDPGHGGHDSGAVGNGLREKDLTLDISLRQAKLFTQLGHQVKISRTADVFVSLSQRAKEANSWGADIFISNHINCGGGIGVEVWHSIHGGKSKEYAAKVEIELAKLIKSRGLKSKQGKNGDYLYVIRATSMPAILNEFGFIDNASDAARLKNSTFRQQLAEAVVNAITGKQAATTTNNSFNSLDGRIGIVATKSSNLIVREGASRESRQIGSLPKGSKVKIYKDCGDGWLEIYYGQHGGYVSKDYIRLI